MAISTKEFKEMVPGKSRFTDDDETERVLIEVNIEKGKVVYWYENAATYSLIPVFLKKFTLVKPKPKTRKIKTCDYYCEDGTTINYGTVIQTNSELVKWGPQWKKVIGSEREIEVIDE